MRRLCTLMLAIAVVSVAGACSGLPTATVKGGSVTVTVQPSSPTVSTFGTQIFTPMVSGSSNTAVMWQVNGVTGGTASTGTISASGVYSAPHFIAGAIIPPNGAAASVTITAISQASPSATGTAIITLVPQGQAAQTGAMELGTSGSNIHASVVSGNSITCCGGTLGSLVVRNGTDYILSNNHVLANSDSATLGDAIIQPGLIDNPAPNTCTSTGTATVANLSQFFTLEGNPSDPVDAAIAQIVSGKVDSSGNILLLGASVDANGVPVAGAPQAGSGEAPSIGLAVAKSGRTTGLTCSTIDSISDAFSVDYQKTCGGTTSYTVNYTNQISVTGGDFSNEGDSGSLIVRQDTANPVALLFAGSDTDTAGSPIGDVLLALADSNNHVPTIAGGAAHQVIGCSLPGPNEVQKTVASLSVSDDAMQTAVAARNTHASQLLAFTGVQGVGAGSSLDDAGQPAVLIFVTPGTVHRNLPVQLDGVRTRIVETSSEAARGIVNAQDVRSIAPQQAAFAVTSLSAAEIARAKVSHSANVVAWMKQPGVQGFGITSSADSPGDAALMIFLIRGSTHAAIPAVIDGVRTRVRESSRFHAGLDGLRQAGCVVRAPQSSQTRTSSNAQSKK
jgi:hypothetical protein